MFNKPDNSEDPAPLTLEQKVEAALYEVPVSLTGGSSPTITASRAATYEPITSGTGLTDVYGLLSSYLDQADDIRGFLEDLVVEIINNNDLTALEKDMVYVFAPDAAEGDPTALALLSNPDYTYDVQLYFETITDGTDSFDTGENTLAVDDCTTPHKLRIQFNEADGGVEGRGWFEFSETDATSNLTTDFSIYTAFDSNGSDGTLKMRVFLNSTDSSSLNTEQLLDYNFRPDMIFIDLNKTGNQVEIAGTSYHPRASDIASTDWPLSAVTSVNGEQGPQMYSFTAIADLGTGAVINLALPPTALDDTETTWTDTLWNEYNLGSLWQEVVRQQLNTFLTELGDDDPDTPGDFNEGNQFVQKFLAANLLNNILALSTTPIENYKSGGTADFTQDEFTTAKTFWDNSTLTDEVTWGDEAISTFDDIIEEVATNSMFSTEEAYINFVMESTDYQTYDYLESYQENLFLLLTAPDIITAAEGLNDPYNIPQADASKIVTYAVEADPDDEWAGSLYPWIAPCLYMINPAFFSDTDGLVGSYNAEKDLFYGKASLGALPVYFDDLYSLTTDLTALDPFIPAEVAGSSFVMDEVPVP